jgi:chitodextrinase
MKMYRNYDGNRSTFGDTSVRATSTANADNLSVFAAERSGDSAATIMVISKVLAGSTPVTVNLSNFAAGTTAQVWQLTAANTIARLADVPVSAQSFATTVPQQSITLFVVAPSGAPANQPPVARATATPTSGNAPLAVAFDGTTSSDPDGSIVSCMWTFGDGGSGTGATTSHTYQNAGVYTASLTVTDNQGATHSTTLSIGVNPAPAAPAAPSNVNASVWYGPPGHARLDRQRLERDRLLHRARRESQEPAVLTHCDRRRECHDIHADRDGGYVGLSSAGVQRRGCVRLLQQRDDSGPIGLRHPRRASRCSSRSSPRVLAK